MRRRPLNWMLAATISFVGLGELGPNLGHPMIVSWDEGAHQAVTRGMHDTWLPVIYRDPLVPIDDGDWFSAGVFLHKPPLPFFLGALIMHVIGVTPLALRLVSLLSALATGLCIFWFSRREVGLGLRALSAVIFFLLPFGWRLVQGVQFGDSTDCSLVGFLSLSCFALVRSVETRSDKFAAFAGACCGAAILCKSALAITPIGIVVVLAVVQAVGFARGFSGRQLAWFGLAGALIAIPYNAYCVWRWPRLFWHAAEVTWSHLGTSVGAWGKPIDALFNDVGAGELGALPMAFFLVAGMWILRVAWRERTPAALVIALWLWAEWIPLSVAKAKVPGTMWGAVPAMLLAAGYLLRDCRTSTTLAIATLGSLLAPPVLALAPGLSFVRSLVPAWLPDTRAMPGLAEGLSLAALGACLGLALRRWGAPSSRAPGALAVLTAAVLGLISNNRALATAKDFDLQRFPISYTEVLGRSLNATVPAKSVLFLAMGRDPDCCAEKQNLMFYSGRMVYPFTPSLLQLAREQGYHPYLISSVAEPFERVDSVPASAWLQAFDLERPGEARAPDGLLAIGGSGDVLGIAVGTDVAGQGRYALYLKGTELARSVPVRFLTSKGELVVDAPLAAALSAPARLASAAWFEVPLVGPPAKAVQRISVGGEEPR